MTKINFFFITLERSYIVQVHTFRKSVDEFFVHDIFVANDSSEWEANSRNRIIRVPREDNISEL